MTAEQEVSDQLESKHLSPEVHIQFLCEWMNLYIFRYQMLSQLIYSGKIINFHLSFEFERSQGFHIREHGTSIDLALSSHPNLYLIDPIVPFIIYLHAT